MTRTGSTLKEAVERGWSTYSWTVLGPPRIIRSRKHRYPNGSLHLATLYSDVFARPEVVMTDIVKVASQMAVEVSRSLTLEAMLLADLAAGCLPKGRRAGISNSILVFYEDVVGACSQRAGIIAPEDWLASLVEDNYAKLMKSGIRHG